MIKKFCDLIVVVVCQRNIALDGVKQAAENLYKISVRETGETQFL